jgi:hypothetical protein
VLDDFTIHSPKDLTICRLGLFSALLKLLGRIVNLGEGMPIGCKSPHFLPQLFFALKSLVREFSVLGQNHLPPAEYEELLHQRIERIETLAVPAFSHDGSNDDNNAEKVAAGLSILEETNEPPRPASKTDGHECCAAAAAANDDDEKELWPLFRKASSSSSRSSSVSGSVKRQKMNTPEPPPEQQQPEAGQEDLDASIDGEFKNKLGRVVASSTPIKNLIQNVLDEVECDGAAKCEEWIKELSFQRSSPLSSPLSSPRLSPRSSPRSSSSPPWSPPPFSSSAHLSAIEKENNAEKSYYDTDFDNVSVLSDLPDIEISPSLANIAWQEINLSSENNVECI